MRSIQELTQILETAKNNNPTKYKRVKNKLTPEELGILEDAVLTRRFISDALASINQMHVQRNEMAAYFGYELLPLLFTEDEILAYATDIFHELSYCKETSDWVIIAKRATFLDVYGFTINEHNNPNKPVIFETWNKAYKTYRDCWYYPECFVNDVIAKIKDRESLIETVNLHNTVFSTATFLSFTHCLENFIIPLIGETEFVAYLSDMAASFAEKYDIADRNHIPGPSIESFIFGEPILTRAAAPAHRRNLIKQGFETKPLIANCYYRAFLPYICGNYTRKEKFINHLNTVCDFSESEWAEIHNRLADPNLFKERSATKDTVILTAANIEDSHVLPNGTTAYDIKDRLSEPLKEAIKQRVPLYRKDLWDHLKNDEDILFQKDIRNAYNNKNIADASFVRSLIDEAIVQSRKEIAKGNRAAILDKKATVWNLMLKRRNGNLEFRNIDISGLTPEMNMEIRIIACKEYDLQQLDFNVQNIVLSVDACRFFMERYRLSCFSEITTSHIALFIHHLEVEKKYSVLTLKNYITALRFAFDTLIKSKNVYYFKPVLNPARTISLPNVPNFVNNTPHIPEEVLRELDVYIAEADEETQLAYEIMMQTGWRFGDIAALSDECVTLINDDEGIAEICVETPKTAEKRESKGYDRFIYGDISISLYNQILEYIDHTSSDRRAYDIHTLFYQIVNNQLVSYKCERFNRRIQKICNAHGLMTIEQEYWSVSSRQTRKTVAVHLISSGASLTSVQNQLGHMSPHTTEMYYAEVQRKTIAELNSEFFRQKFDVLMDEEKLKLFTEDERRILYIDFASNKRNVELGICSKHPSEGHCSTLGQSSCADCSKLCTGRKFLDKWKALQADSLALIEEYEATYQSLEIPEIEYKEFIEYKQERHLYDKYTAVITAIEKGGSR